MYFFKCNVMNGFVFWVLIYSRLHYTPILVIWDKYSIIQNSRPIKLHDVTWNRVISPKLLNSALEFFIRFLRLKSSTNIYYIIVNRETSLSTIQINNFQNNKSISTNKRKTFINWISILAQCINIKKNRIFMQQQLVFD